MKKIFFFFFMAAFCFQSFAGPPELEFAKKDKTETAIQNPAPVVVAHAIAPIATFENFAAEFPPGQCADFEFYRTETATFADQEATIKRSCANVSDKIKPTSTLYITNWASNADFKVGWQA